MHIQPSSSLWHGSVLLVTKPGQLQPPQLRLRQVGPVAGNNGQAAGDQSSRVISGLRLFEDPGKAFWRFSISVPVEEYEAG